MWKHHTKLRRRGESSGWVDIETALGVFRRMAAAVKVLHGGYRSGRKVPIVHMDLRPEHFAAYKTSKDVTKGCKYIVKLVGAGCAIDGYMPLDSVADRMKAARLIDSTTSSRYRAPEMINLQLADELDDSADICGLGCCLYGILFSKDCFQKDGRLNILKGKYDIPSGHPYSQDVLDLLARLLTVEPEKRPGIHDVISCIDALASGKSLPPKRSRPVRVPVSDRVAVTPDSFAKPHSNFGDKVTIGDSRRPSCTSSLTPRSHCDSTLSTWDYESDMSVETEWLEFVPDDMSGSCHRRFSEPASTMSPQSSRGTSEKDAAVYKSSRDNSTVDSSSQRSKRSLTHWTYGVVDRMSSRSLIFVDGDSSEDDDTFDGNRFSTAGSTFKAPSVRELGGSRIQTTEGHMVNTSPSPDDCDTPRASLATPSPRLHQKRRPSTEKHRDMPSVGAKTKANKPRMVRTKVGSPSTTTRKTSTENTFHASFPSHGAFHGGNHVPAASPRNRRAPRRQSMPILPPPPSPRKTNEKAHGSKQRSRRNHKDLRQSYE